jgi:hypothetical protein
MLFTSARDKPLLRVTYLKVEDSRTYITDRIREVVRAASSKYQISESHSKFFRGIKFDQSLVFEHADGKFKVVEWGDRDHPDKMECGEIVKHPECQYVLKCQYNPEWRTPKVRPFFYFEKTKPKEFSDSLDVLRSIPKTSKYLYWRGNLHLGRDKVLQDLKDLTGSNYEQRLPLNEYYSNMAQHRVALSLPGLGKSCHREFECFAIGTVVVSPKFQNIYHVPIIPDYHYLAVDDLSQIRQKLSEVTQEKIDSIRSNAIRYYDENIRFEQSVKWLWHLLEL